MSSQPLRAQSRGRRRAESYARYGTTLLQGVWLDAGASPCVSVP